jgi:hypothetical protein
MSTATTIQNSSARLQVWLRFGHRDGNHSAGAERRIIRLISAKKKEPEFMLNWRLKAFRHWQTMKEPTAFATYPPIDYQSSIYYAAPNRRSSSTASTNWTRSW